MPHGEGRWAGLWLCAVVSCLTAAVVLDVGRWRPPDTAVASAVWGLRAQAHDLTRRFAWDVRNVAALLVSFLIAALANAAGVGGGAALVPLFNILLAFSLKSSTALSQAAITGGSVASVVFSLFKRHPLDDAVPVLDFELALLLTPMLLLGISMGVLLNAVLPNWLLVVLLTILLAYVTQRTARKGVQLFIMEHKLKQAQQPAGNSPSLSHASSPHAPAPAPDSPAAEEPVETPDMHLTLPVSVPKNTSLHTHSSLRSPQLSMQRSSSHPPADGNAAMLAEIFEHMHSPMKASVSPDIQRRLSACLAGLPEDGQAGSPRGWPFERAASMPFTAQHAQRAQPDQAPDGDATAADSMEQGEPPDVPAEGSHARPSRYHSPCRQLGHAAQLVVLWVLFQALQLRKTRYNECSASYFAYWGAQAAVALAASASQILPAAWAQRQPRRANSAEGVSAQLLPKASGAGPTDAKSVRLLLHCSLFTLVGGLVAGLLGIGGGMIIGPLLLELGVHPLVTAATSGLIVLFSSSSATLAFATAGRLNVEYGVIYAATSAVASLVGVSVVSRVVRNSGRPSIIVLILAVVIGLGAVATIGFGGWQAVQDVRHGEHVSFRNPCIPS